MKTKLIKVLALTLALLMLAVCFVSCKKDEELGEETTGAGEDSVSTESAETETDIYEGLRGIGDKYSGQDFVILDYDKGTGWLTYYANQTEENASGTLNDAAIKRNGEVNELLGVNIKTEIVNQTEMVEYIKTTTNAGMVTYDLIAFYATNRLEDLVASNYLYNIKKVPYMDTTKEWYNQNANRNFTLKQKQYCFVSDLSITVQQRFAFLANNDMLEEYGVLEQFGVETIYELVSKGDWNIDNMKKIIKDVNSEPDNSQMSYKYGLVTNPNGVSRFINNWGYDIVALDDHGRFVFNLKGSALEDIVAELTNLCHNNNNVFCVGEKYGNSASGNGHYEIFENGNTMFATFSSDPWMLAGDKYQDGSFAYIPYPKYTGQENYITVTHGGIMSFSLNTRDIEFSGAVVEALSAASHKYMVDAYKTNYFEARVIQDPQGLEMYQIIIDTAYYDMARYIDPSVGGYSGEPENLCNYLNYFTYIIREQRSLESRYASHGPTISKCYTDFYTKLPTE